MIIKSLKVLAYIGESEAISYYDTSITEGNYDILSLLSMKLEESEYITDWKIFDGENQVAAKATVATGGPDKATELLKERCRELYALHENYAQVAKLVGKHPTTVRTWLKESL